MVVVGKWMGWGRENEAFMGAQTGIYGPINGRLWPYKDTGSAITNVEDDRRGRMPPHPALSLTVGRRKKAA